MCGSPREGRTGKGGGQRLLKSLEAGQGIGRQTPHLPVGHRFAFEFAVGVCPQSCQLLLTRESPVPLLATVVVHREIPKQAPRVWRRPQTPQHRGGKKDRNHKR